MDNGKVIFTVECDEPEGKVVRHVRPARLSFERLGYYYDKLKVYDVLFNDFIRGDLASFLEIFLANDGQGGIQATGLIWEVDDVGLLFVTDIRSHECLAHFTFWDRRIRGREDLLKEGVKYLFNRFGFHRVETQVPLYAAPWLSRAVESVGFKKEGRLREKALYKGKWFDVNVYSILENEV